MVGWFKNIMDKEQCKRMSWRAVLFLKGDGYTADDREDRRKFGLKSRGTPPQIEEMKDFEDDLAK